MEKKRKAGIFRYLDAVENVDTNQLSSTQNVLIWTPEKECYKRWLLSLGYCERDLKSFGLA